MLGKSSVSDRNTLEFADVDAVGRKLATGMFGGKHGVAVFLGALVFFSLTWRVGILSSDNFTVANSVVAVANGHFHIEQIIFGPPDGVTPGTYTINGRLYGRNYGLVVPAVVVYLLLQTLSLILDLRILFAGVWSLMILAFAVVLGDLTGMRDRAMAAGAGLSLLFFVTNVLTATPLDPYWLPVVALQMVTALGAALIAVVMYRLVSAIYDRRLGLFAGFATALGTPVGFWATFPKRHTLSALFVVLTVYTLYRSRSASTATWQTRFRALAYAWVGLLAWLHAAEALILFVGLLAVDVPTAHRNGIRELTVIGGVFLVSLIPFALTNTLIAGTPFQTPRMLDAYGGVDVGGLTGGGESGAGGGGCGDGTAGGSGGGGGAAGGGGSGGGAAGGGGIFSPVSGVLSAVSGVLSLVGGVFSGLLSRVVRPMTILVGQFTSSLSTLVEDSSRLFTVFLRRGYVSVKPELFKPIQLSVLESMPLLGALTVVPLHAWRRLRRGLGSLSLDPVRITDVFVLVVMLLWMGLYLSSLPLHFQYTVRYFHPIYPLGVYLLVRLPAVRNAVSSRPSTAIRSYIATVVLGLAIYIIVLSLVDAVVSEAVQFYAVVAFVLGTGVAVWALTATTVSYGDRLGAIVLGIATASMTVYILVSGFVTFAYTNEYLLPIGRVIAESLRFVNPFGYLF